MASTRFAVLVPARNEELVVGSLINTLLMVTIPQSSMIYG